MDRPVAIANANVEGNVDASLCASSRRVASMAEGQRTRCKILISTQVSLALHSTMSDQLVAIASAKVDVTMLMR